MKTKIALISVVGVFLGVSVFAASMSLSPLNVAVKPGQTFNVLVSLDPQSGKISTAKVELKYPADLVEATGFSFVGPSWIALAQEGYDLMDNTNGSMIKTAGYPKGASVPLAFGTATFRAKKAGVATISVGDKTLLLGADGMNSLSGAVTPVSVSITVPVATPAPTLKATVVSSQPTVQPSASPEATESATPTPSVAPSVQQASILSTMGNVFNLGTGNGWVGFIVLLVVLYGIYWIIRQMLKKNN